MTFGMEEIMAARCMDPTSNLLEDFEERSIWQKKMDGDARLDLSFCRLLQMEF